MAVSGGLGRAVGRWSGVDSLTTVKDMTNAGPRPETSVAAVDLEVEFYEDGGHKPVETFLAGLDSTKRLAVIAAIEQVLAKQGIGVCRSSWGRMLGGGLFEFRVRHTAAEIRQMFGGDPPSGRADNEGPPGKVLLRVFCHAYGNRIVLLVGGYDKGKHPSTKRQQQEIETARKRLATFKIGSEASGATSSWRVNALHSYRL